LPLAGRWGGAMRKGCDMISAGGGDFAEEEDGEGW